LATRSSGEGSWCLCDAVGGEIEAGGGGCREMGELIGQGRPWWQRGSEGGGSGRGEVEAVIARGTLVLLK